MTSTGLLTLLLLLFTAWSRVAVGQSCVGRCGVEDNSKPCQCNSVCHKYGDCCDDYEDVCLSCSGRCGESYDHAKPCQCNDQCSSHKNCCGDYNAECGSGGLTDDDLRGISEEIFEADVNNVYDQLTLDYQGQGNSGDLAEGLLFVSVPDSALSGPTISRLLKVQDNYNPYTTQPETQTQEEVEEQNDFLDAILDTKIMTITETFLHANNLLSSSQSLRDELERIWFTLYYRDPSSSGFEHSFVGEIKGGSVSGFHNWVNFQKEEAAGNINYQGWMNSTKLADKGEVLMDRFEWFGNPKRIGSMFIGTSPELEMAAYTICFLARPDSLCPVQMGGKEFHIQTWTIHDNLVGSAYPDIDYNQ